MGLLGDLYSSLDSTKRRLSGLLSDPMGTLAQKVAQLEEDQNGLLNLQANAYPMAGNRTVLNSPDQIAQFRQELADAAANMGMAGATVWHGSPHKFDKFDSSKIGTGEGAQAYGHGLYLAENPEVAREYQKNLATEVSLGGKPFITGSKGNLVGSTGNTVLDDYLHANMGDLSATRANILADTKYVKSGNPQGAKEYQQALADLRKVRGDMQSVNSGALYKVDLPDEHIAKMLDWDKPLSQQAPEVLASLSNTKNKQLRAIVDYASSPYSTPGLEGEVKTMGEAIKLLGMNTSPAKGSTMLAKQGIPGIRYLDGGSRGAGVGTSNYVVFPGNEGLLKILERNGQDLGF